MFPARHKHQAELLKLYTNPKFEIAQVYARVLSTVFVTLTYSSGLPLVNLFAILYFFANYWVDKAVLLWGSRRPPAFDARIPMQAATILLYAGLEVRARGSSKLSLLFCVRSTGTKKFKAFFIWSPLSSSICGSSLNLFFWRTEMLFFFSCCLVFRVLKRLLSAPVTCVCVSSSVCHMLSCSVFGLRP